MYDSVVNYDQAAFDKLLDEEQDQEELDRLAELEAEEELDPYVMAEEDEDDDDDDEDEEEDIEDAGIRQRAPAATTRAPTTRRAGLATKKRERIIIESEVEAPAAMRRRTEETHDW